MKSVKFQPLLLFSIMVLLVIGCVTPSKQPAPKIDYYTLEYDPPTFNRLRQVPIIIRVNRFQVSPIYNTTNIIYKEKAFKRDEYYYHKWRANPGDLVTYFLARDLRESGLFKGVFILSSKYLVSHVIDGTLDAFYQLSSGDSWQAVLSVNITFMKDNEPDISKRILFQKQYTVQKPCEVKHPRSLAEAMSLAMSEISGKIVNDIFQRVSDK